MGWCSDFQGSLYTTGVQMFEDVGAAQWVLEPLRRACDLVSAKSTERGPIWSVWRVSQWGSEHSTAWGQPGAKPLSFWCLWGVCVASLVLRVTMEGGGWSQPLAAAGEMLTQIGKQEGSPFFSPLNFQPLFRTPCWHKLRGSQPS